MASTLTTAPPARSLVRNPTYVTLETDEMSGGSPPYSQDQENLSCHLEVWRDISGGGEEQLGVLRSPYSTTDKRTTFDISGILRRLGHALPSAASIGISAGDPYYGEAVGLTDVYRLKHADQYGVPVVVESLTTSSDYLAIQGGLPADAVQSINYAGAAIGLHSYLYRRSDAYPFFKPVSTSQPDWLYFVALVSDDFVVTVTIHYDDGTTDVYAALTMTIEADKAYWVQSGHDQLKVSDNADPAKVVRGYNVSIIRSTGPVNVFTAFYVLDDVCPPWEKIILYHNGFGGYETVRMKGLTTYGHVVDRQIFTRTRWNDFTIEDGDVDHIRTPGSAIYNTHTGHYPAHYVNHLRQLLHGKLWLVDTLWEEQRFKRIICRTDEVDILSDDIGPAGFAISWAQAWTDDGYNVY